MKINELFYEELFIKNFEAKNKKEALKSLSQILEQKDFVNSSKDALKGFLAREKQFSTGIGFGFAIPHIRIDAVKKPSILFAKSDNGIEWKSMDKNKVNYIFMISIPMSAEAGNDHMAALGELSRSFMKEEFRNKVSEINSVDELKKLFE